MADKEIIIDGVNVSECFYYVDNKEYNCTLNKTPFHYRHCKENPNCYFQLLKRKEQECEKYKQALNKIEKYINSQGINHKWNMYIQRFRSGILNIITKAKDGNNEVLSSELRKCEYCKHLYSDYDGLNCYCELKEAEVCLDSTCDKWEKDGE